EEAGPRGLTAPYLAARLGVTEASADALRGRLREGGAVAVSQGVLASRAAKTAIEDRLAAFFAARKAQGAPSAFAPRAEALAALGKGFPHHVAESWLVHLTAAKVLTAKDDLVGPHGTAEAPANEASSFASRIAEAYRLAGFEEPRAFELAKALAAKTQVVEGLVGHLLKSGVLVRLSPDLVVHKETVDAAAAKLASAKGRPLRVGDFRDLLGLTRKTLIPLLEHFDARKLTRRNGDFREVV
ncbi:MAG: SelB C-terminal domain-containing protein, partial [Acidobacteria bacterium]|nr:SelB C-terminal domain-containing protein [Acidobacteriota bacterium]